MPPSNSNLPPLLNYNTQQSTRTIKIGTKVAKLSVKTNKKSCPTTRPTLPRWRQNFPPTAPTDPALASVDDVRDDVRDSYCGNLAIKKGVIGGLPPMREDGYITGGAGTSTTLRWGRTVTTARTTRAS